MKKFTKIFLTMGLVVFPLVSHAQLYSSCDQWGNYTTNGYTIYNNIWGSGAGTQCLTVYAYNNWSVVATHPATSGIKSYPNVAADVNYNISALGSCTSSFTVTRPGSGAYNTSYDIWCNNYAYEIMLWVNYTGAVGPIAESWDASGNPVANYTNLSVGGHTWNVYRGSNGSNTVFSFLRTSNTNSGTVDIKAILNWLKSVNWFGDVNLHRIQFGFEITSNNSTSATFACTAFSLSHSSGSTVATTGVTVSPTSASIAVNGTQQLTATVLPTNATNKSVTWSTSNSTVATVSTSGLVTGKAAGSSIITVTTSSGSYKATSTITVTSSSTCSATTITPYVQINGGSWSQTATASVSAGATVKFGPQPVSGGSWAWAGPNSFTATTREVTITSITTGQAGTYVATYTNSCGTKSTQNFVVTVSGGTTVSVTGITVSPTSASVNVGSTTTLTATVSPTNATNKSVTWSSSNTALASVSTAGVVTGVGTGTATITVKTVDQSKIATATITVTSSSSTTTCSNPTTISIPFSFNGAGEYCWSTSTAIAYVNSWNTDKVTINGVDYTNKWSNTMPAAVNGKWTIYYKGSYAWSHFEAPQAKSADDIESDAVVTEGKNLSLFPNPLNGNVLNIQVGIKELSEIGLNIYNAVGQKVFEQNFGEVENGIFEQSLDLKELSKGSYILEFKTDNTTQTQLLLIQ